MSEKILILGSSIAGAKAAIEIKKAKPECDVTILSYDKYLPIRPDICTELLNKKSSINDVLYKDEKFYKAQSINVVLGQEVTRINLKRKKIHLEDRNQMDFDKVIITELPGYRFPEIKGYNKTGVLGFQKSSDMEDIKKQIILSDAIVIQADSWKALDIALKMAQYQKEVCVVSRAGTFSQTFAESWLWLSGLLAQQKLTFIVGQDVQEILGDSEVKAVRLSSGKVIAADAILLEETPPDFRIFSDEDIVLNKAFPMKSEFETQLDGVYVLPQLTDYKNAPESIAVLEQQGSRLASAVLGQEANNDVAALYQKTIQLNDLSLQLIGRIDGTDGQEIVSFSSEEKKYRKFILHHGMVKGAVMLNAEHDVEKVKQFIASQATESDLAQFGLTPIIINETAVTSS